MNNLTNIEKFIKAGYELSVRKMDVTQSDGSPYFHAAVFVIKPNNGHNHLGRTWTEAVEKLDEYLGSYGAAGFEP